jgi:hypothetical protein
MSQSAFVRKHPERERPAFDRQSQLKSQFNFRTSSRAAPNIQLATDLLGASLQPPSGVPSVQRVSRAFLRVLRCGCGALDAELLHANRSVERFMPSRAAAQLARRGPSRPA